MYALWWKYSNKQKTVFLKKACSCPAAVAQGLSINLRTRVIGSIPDRWGTCPRCGLDPQEGVRLGFLLSLLSSWSPLLPSSPTAQPPGFPRITRCILQAQGLGPAVPRTWTAPQSPSVWPPLHSGPSDPLSCPTFVHSRYQSFTYHPLTALSSSPRT
uniref:Uncharacterized protein n=1 Tax=Myotis myotis TaxID=51298 RepID=A0A7J7UDC6_MYOMY|nr:hypothetical protein mMyoMyo1_008810 [Myotis myotis]